MSSRNRNSHRINRSGWLRAAVLGADDGIVSTASLVLGVATANASHGGVLIAAISGLAAGSMSMAAGEYVSVHSQADTEKAELKRERRELHDDAPGERRELAAIYVQRGLDAKLAEQVAKQLMRHDALDAHARDELGITEPLRARPLQAATASALSYASGALLPVLIVAFAPAAMLIALVAAVSLLLLFLLGTVAARVGGANMLVGGLRISFWGALAMAITAGVGKGMAVLFGIGG